MRAKWFYVIANEAKQSISSRIRLEVTRGRRVDVFYNILTSCWIYLFGVVSSLINSGQSLRDIVPALSLVTELRVVRLSPRFFPTKKHPFRSVVLAERGRFELPVPTSSTTDFESAAFDHSATFPRSYSVRLKGWRPLRNLLCPASPYNRLEPRNKQTYIRFHFKCQL